MKIATWNVNSIRVRLPRALAWLKKEQPHVLCMQELKVQEEQFPREAFEELGYQSAVRGQKTYNGVAILSKTTPNDVIKDLSTQVTDPKGGDTQQARFISAEIEGITILNVYCPNGSTPDSPKYAYKLRWFEALLKHLEEHCDPNQPLCIVGDFNIAPEERDINRPDEWNDTVLCLPEVRAVLKKIEAWGLQDVFRKHHQEPGLYTWWDYRKLGFQTNNGLRIDHILATESLAKRCTEARIDRNERKGKQPSDHAPVIAEYQ